MNEACTTSRWEIEPKRVRPLRVRPSSHSEITETHPLLVGSGTLTLARCRAGGPPG